MSHPTASATDDQGNALPAPDSDGNPPSPSADHLLDRNPRTEPTNADDLDYAFCSSKG